MKEREGSTKGKGGLNKKLQIPTLSPKWQRSGVTFHFVWKYNISNDCLKLLSNLIWKTKVESAATFDWSNTNRIVFFVAIFGDLSRIWLLLTPFGSLSFLASFWLLLKILLKTGFKPVLTRFWLFLFVLWCWYFCLLKDLLCRCLEFSQVLWCRSLGFF